MPPDAQPQPSPQNTDDKPTRSAKLGASLSLFVIGGLFVSMLGVPVKLTAGLFAVAAIATAIMFFVAAKRDKRPVSWFVLGAVSLFVSFYLILGTLGAFIIYPVQAAYQECTSTALTQQAQAACMSEYNKGVNERFRQLTGVDMPMTPLESRSR